MFEYQASISIKLQSQNVAYVFKPQALHRTPRLVRFDPRGCCRMSQAVTKAASQRQALDDKIRDIPRLGKYFLMGSHEVPIWISLMKKNIQIF